MPSKQTTVRSPISLRRLFPQASFVGCADIGVQRATEHSDRCDQSTLFAALPGTRTHGESHIAAALDRGAAALLLEQPDATADVPQCVVPNARQAFAKLCAALAGEPSHSLQVAGVTGTNGKTTVTWLLRSIFRQAGYRSGLLGTIEYDDSQQAFPASLTTPDSGTLSELLASMVASGATHAAIELSSHALEQKRAAGTRLAAAVVTNVTHDHFDYHGNFANYLASKAQIAALCDDTTAFAINADDPGACQLAECLPETIQPVRFGIDQPADFSARILAASLSDSQFEIRHDGSVYEVTTALIGKHNVTNCLAAFTTAVAMGVAPKTAIAGIEAVTSVPGRLERIKVGQPFEVFVDFAHTADALRNVIETLQSLTSGRIICVVGAGGDRDKAKRPLIGNAADLADLPVFTSDNPRSEDPMRIVEEIRSGVSNPEACVEVDRKAAIEFAIQAAEQDDCVLIAGKGHETTQQIGDRVTPFDDRTVAREAILKKFTATSTQVGA